MALLGTLAISQVLFCFVFLTMSAPIPPAFLRLQPLLFLDKAWQEVQHIYIVYARIYIVLMYTYLQGNSSQPGCPDLAQSH